MQNLSDADIAGLIGSRICHDLISPVGAICNGLELLGMSGAPAQPEMALIGDSAESATARIRFFRIAFGAAGNEKMGAGEVADILNGISRSTRQKIEWRAPGASARSEVRLAFLALQCCEAAMPFGGAVQIDCADRAWQVTASGSRLAVDDALWSVLGGPGTAGQINPAQVQFALLPRLIAKAERKLEVTVSDTNICIRF